MPNRLTRVPNRPVPDLPAYARPALPVADLFMVAMISRPDSGSLRTTWVTPATLQMSLGLVVACILAGVFAVAAATGGNAAAIVLCVAVLALALGAGAVALVGIAQRSS